MNFWSQWPTFSKRWRWSRVFWLIRGQHRQWSPRQQPLKTSIQVARKLPSFSIELSWVYCSPESGEDVVIFWVKYSHITRHHRLFQGFIQVESSYFLIWLLISHWLQVFPTENTPRTLKPESSWSHGANDRWITVWWVGTSWSTTQLHPSSLKNDENFGSRNANIRKNGGEPFERW